MVLLTAACRRQQATQQAVVRDAATPTPISTPLPPVPTPVPVGESEDNPLRMVIKPYESALARNGLARFQSALQDASGLVIEVVLVERQAEALAALCNSSSGPVSVAWLDGVGYMAAIEQNCGLPALQVERGRGRDATTGQAGQLVARADLGIASVSQLSGDHFCRLGFADFYSWLVPLLLFRANGVDPLTDLRAITDYEERSELLEAVAEGDCDATGIPEGALGDDVRDEIDVVETTVAFPYAVLMYPIEVPLGIRLRLTDALVSMSQDSDDAEMMQPLLGQDGLARVNVDDFIEFRNFMDSTGLDFAQLGG
jgi:ABC-type phosphate/phosphonate transport system substrate-binding protein